MCSSFSDVADSETLPRTYLGSNYGDDSGEHFLVPIRIVSLRSGDTSLVPYLVLLVPAAWSIFMLWRYRSRRERIVAWFSLALTALWFLLVGSIRT